MLDSRDDRVPHYDDEALTSMLVRAKERSGSLRQGRRRRRLLVGTAGVMCALILCLVAALVLGWFPAARTQASKVASPALRMTEARLHWKLVAAVASLWHLSPQEGTKFNLTCPSGHVCYAEAQTGHHWTVEVTTDGGAQWVESSVPESSGTPLSCPSATVCATLGGHLSQTVFEETTNGGTTWHTEPFPPEEGAVLSCTTATSCVAIAKSCPRPTACVTILNPGAATAFVTADGGANWTSYELPTGVTQTPSSIRCFSDGACAALGNVESLSTSSGAYPTLKLTLFGIYSTDGGKSWSLSEVPAGFTAGTDMACAGPTSCLDIGTSGSNQGSVAVSVDGGRKWSLASTPLASQGAVELNWLACANDGPCFAAGLATGGKTSDTPSPFVVETSDRGATWRLSTLPTGVHAVGQLSCPAARTCYAFGSASLSTGKASSVFLSTTG